MSLQTLEYASQPETISPGSVARRREDRSWAKGLSFVFLTLLATFALMKVTMAFPGLTARCDACFAMVELGLVLAAIVWRVSHHRRSEGSWAFARGAFIGGITALAMFLVYSYFLKTIFQPSYQVVY